MIKDNTFAFGYKIYVVNFLEEKPFSRTTLEKLWFPKILKVEYRSL